MLKYLMVLIVATNCDATTTFRQAQEVFAQIQNATGYHVVLKYSKELDSNAWADANSVTINQGMLNDCRNKRELSMVLGHEIGHWIHQDFRSSESETQELRADKFGYKVCQKLGNKNCTSFMRLMLHKYGDDHDEVHPSWDRRIKHVTN